MKTRQSMKPGRWLSPIALSVLVWTIAALMCSGVPVSAATSAQTATGSQATRVDSSILINVSGVVVAPDGTRITVSGSVTVKCSAVPDISGALTSVVLAFDFSNVTATTGSGANQVTYDTKGFRCTKIRPLKVSDVIAIVCPYSPSGGAASQAKTLLVTASLNFNVSTGQLVSGSITVGNNTFSSTV
ncbi:MAG TPA: hypothetical protein VKF81_02815 [Blastocatellia bacterium]|nr:hypothetical protein [Blastocatellia bacterium]